MILCQEIVDSELSPRVFSCVSHDAFRFALTGREHRLRQEKAPRLGLHQEPAASSMCWHFLVSTMSWHLSINRTQSSLVIIGCF